MTKNNKLKKVSKTKLWGSKMKVKDLNFGQKIKFCVKNRPRMKLLLKN